MDQRQPKPHTPGEIRERLDAAQDTLGKGGRRIATFLSNNLEAAAVLSSSEVAERCRVNASSVVRLAQSVGFSGYRDLQAALHRALSASVEGDRVRESATTAVPRTTARLRLRLIADSGRSFVEDVEAAAARFDRQDPSVKIRAEVHVSYTVEPERFAAQLEAAGSGVDGVILVAREHPTINDAVRALSGRGIPVICLTTDLPNSGRTAYVGSDQYASGATAGWLCGRMVAPGRDGRVLFIHSVPFRCHQDREQGFRQVLRSEFPALTIDERMSSDESAEVVYDAVRHYVLKSGPPAAIYNVSGANLGVARALEDTGSSSTTLFIGHELNASSRSLLERGIMDVTIGHDFEREITLAVDCIRRARMGERPASRITQSQVFTRFNCHVF